MRGLTIYFILGLAASVAHADDIFDLSALLGQNSAAAAGTAAAAAAASDDHSLVDRPGGAIRTHIPIAVQNFMVETLHSIIESYCHRNPHRGLCLIPGLFTRDAIASDLDEL